MSEVHDKLENSKKASNIKAVNGRESMDQKNDETKSVFQPQSSKTLNGPKEKLDKTRVSVHVV